MNASDRKEKEGKALIEKKKADEAAKANQASAGHVGPSQPQQSLGQQQWPLVVGEGVEAWAGVGALGPNN